MGTKLHQNGTKIHEKMQQTNHSFLESISGAILVANGHRHHSDLGPAGRHGATGSPPLRVGKHLPASDLES